VNKPFRNYHMCLTPVSGSGPNRIWRCDYCGQQGPITAMQTSQCSHSYNVCKHCGGSPDSNECKRDCPGIAAILADPSIHVIGSLSEES